MKKENFLNKIIRKLKELFNNGNISETRGKLSPSATLGNQSKSITVGWFSPSATLGVGSKSITEGNKSPSATLGNQSKSKTKGDKSHSATLGDKSKSRTEGVGAICVSLGENSLSETKGKNSITCMVGNRSIVKAHHGLVIIVKYDKNNNPLTAYSALVGGKILDVTIEPDKYYGIDSEEKFRMFTEEEVLEILNPSLKD